MAEYADRWITCDDTGIRIRGYYFPWGTKHIAYPRIVGLRRAEMGPLTGRGRIWGTANPRYWAGLDPKRMSKSIALVLDLGGRVKPVLTPDDPDAAEAVIRQHVQLPQDAGRAPIF
jgi:hypothetical protein